MISFQVYFSFFNPIYLKNLKVTKTHGCVGKKTALLQPDFFIGFANVLFCGLGVVDPNAPLRRKAGGEN